MDEEEWKAVPNYENFYEVSSHGNVRSKGRHISYNNRFMPGVPLKPWIRNPGAYLLVRLCKNGSNKNFRISRLVLLAFVGPEPKGMEACHNDGDTANNRLTNLRWDTRLGNAADRYKHGTASSVLNEQKVLEILAHIHAGETRAKIATTYGVTPNAISAIKSGRCWAHLSQKENRALSPV